MRFLFCLAATLLVANFLIYRAILAPHLLTISVLEVGKGDATLVQTPNRKTILIDAGPDASILRALGTALPFWQRTIDGIILTSEKASATGGLSDVTNRYHAPAPIRFGTVDIPYGTCLIFDAVHINVFWSDIFTISYGAASLSISSSTPKGVYISDGKTVTKIK